MYVRDTIAAISTPPGNGGIGIIRVSGDKAASVGNTLFIPLYDGGLVSHRFYFGTIIDPTTNSKVDEAMAVIMKSPKSYTREDVLELHCHGGWFVVEKVLSLVLSSGVRLADPGEFTKRAFLNGRIDLIQAEAVMDIIASKNDSALLLAESQQQGKLSKHFDHLRQCLMRSLALVEAYIDFPDDDIGETDIKSITNSVVEAGKIIDALISSFDQGRILREGISVLILGKPNVGKSSLLNCLLDENRAIVTHIPGTTRDIIEETINFNGLAVKLLDTAGIRDTDDPVEMEGIRRAVEKIPLADVVLVIFDASAKFTKEDQFILDMVSDCKAIAVLNKSDLPLQLIIPNSANFLTTLNIAAISGLGIDILKQTVSKQFLHHNQSDSREFLLLSKARHRDALLLANQAVQQFNSQFINRNLELLALDLRSALQAVGSVTGQTATDEILDLIFSSFCIGK